VAEDTSSKETRLDIPAVKFVAADDENEPQYVLTTLHFPRFGRVAFTSPRLRS